MLRFALVLVTSALALTAHYTEASIARVITGEASFVKRNTVVAMAVCGEEPCPKPQPYWAVNIIQNGVQYELNQVFGLGRAHAPEEVEIAGTRISEGALIEIEGNVTMVNDRLGILSQVNKATVINSPVALDILPTTFNWMCQSPDGSVPKMYVNVRYQITDPRAENYYMNIAMATIADDVSYFPIAEILDARSVCDETRLSYVGEVQKAMGTVAVQLVIEKARDLTEHSMLNLPSALVLAGPTEDLRALGITDAAEGKKIYPVTCTRTRSRP